MAFKGEMSKSEPSSAGGSSPPTSPMNQVGGAPSSTGSNQTFSNPLAGSALPPELGVAPPPTRGTDPDGTAMLAAAAIDGLCTVKYGIPLSAQETSDLRADFAAVFRKHDIPDVPMLEEGKLGLNLVGISMRRHAVEKQQRPAQPKGATGDSSGVRKEGQREVHNPAQAGFPSGIVSPSDILS